MQWTSLRDIGNSHAVKLTIFVPVVGYLVLLNESLLPYIELSRQVLGLPEGQTQESAHVSWRLLSLYVGLSLVAVGSALHQVFCPDEIKRFGSSVEYTSATIDQMGTRMLKQIEEALGRDPVARDGLAALIQQLEIRRESAMSQEDHPKAFSKYYRDVLELHFLVLNGSRAEVRWCELVLYVLGFAILAVPTVNVFYRVVGLLIAQLFGQG